MAEGKPFEPITAEEKAEIAEMLTKTVNNEFRKDKISEDYYKYIVILQNTKFITEMTVTEVEESAKLVVDILEELKNRNNGGLTRRELDELEKKNNIQEFDGSDAIQVLQIWDGMKDKRLSKLIAELDRVRRVGRAWAMLIANPCFISAVCVVYYRIADAFNDDDLYLQSAYFLIRAAMIMNSDNYKE